MATNSCPLCLPFEPHATLWQDARCHVIDVSDPEYPGYCRVVWKVHVREMTDLDLEERAHVMMVVYAVEAGLRMLLQPTKINLAALGNQVPHLHWHVIPRFPDDPHFPDAIWSTRRRAGASRKFDRDLLRRELERQLGASP